MRSHKQHKVTHIRNLNLKLKYTFEEWELGITN